MKAKLAEVTQDAPSAEIVEPEVLQRHFAKFDEAFFTLCSKGMFDKCMTVKSSFNEKLNIPQKNIFQRFEFSRQKYDPN